jgi:hypothetical protein
MRKSEAKISDETAKLRAYIKIKPFGAEIWYDEVEKETGVIMNYSGRQKLRAALVACHREWEVFKNLGYKLDSVENTSVIVKHRFKKVYEQVKKTSRCCDNLSVHLPNLPEDEQLNFRYIQTITRRQEISSEETVDKIYTKEIKKLQTQKPLVRE